MGNRCAKRAPESQSNCEALPIQLPSVSAPLLETDHELLWLDLLEVMNQDDIVGSVREPPRRQEGPVCWSFALATAL